MHDKNGHPLAVGDRVTIEATIAQAYAGEEYCNLTCETTEPMYPGTSKTTITLNARQVVFEAPATMPAPAPLSGPDAAL